MKIEMMHGIPCRMREFKKFSFEMDADVDWEPLQQGCIQDCPFACLAKDNRCYAKDVYDRTGRVICPFKGMTEIKEKEVTLYERIQAGKNK